MFKWIEETDLALFPGWNSGLILTNKEIRAERRAICDKCESRMAIMCKKWGCVIRAKTSVAFEKCPIDKWLPTEK